MKKLAAAVLASTALILASCGQASTDEWALHGRDHQEQRYSPLDQINRENVAQLGLAWHYQFESDRGQEATPIQADGVIYTSVAWSVVYALDAETGELLWSYDPQVPREALADACCDAVNRGVALRRDRVFVGTLDGRLIALNSRTGELVWSVDTVDHSVPGRHYTITGAPRVVKDKIVIGNAGAEFGVRGYVTAYDAASGEQAWRFYLTPNPEGRADGAASDDVMRDVVQQTWSPGEWTISGGGGTAWDSMTYDPDTNLLFIGAGNGSPFDFYRRSGGQGDNLFLSSIVAVNPDTGAYVWHYQTSPSDSWDYTATQHMIATRLTINGQERDVLMQAPKNGYFYVLDRRTGELLSATPYAPVTWSTGVDMETGRPILAENAHYQTGTALLQPGPFGAHSWQAMSFSPRTGLVYIPVQLMGGGYARDPNFQRRPVGQNVAIQLPEFPQDQLAAIRAATTGQLVAWDPVAGRARWTVEHPYFLNGGTLVTAGDLVFQGNAEGHLVAYDATNGEQVWSYDAGTGIIAPPISYRINGQQYIAIMVGFGGAGAIVGRVVPDRPRMPGRLLVFRLGGTAEAPAYDPPPSAPIDVTGITSRGNADLGMAEYNRTCATCHGGNASVAYNADLRRSGALRSEELWRSVVIDGALEDNGMIAFRDVLTPREAENIRAYVLRHARQSQRRGEE
ncbi:PQQ-dependent dehydrogenase, methanol/ethanol family [Terricaulis silvestris]|uniref:Quinohemoprotein alcohol dehydrogenase ADH-IIG n=1 Tax=Terricaulis silvestris TaxID=2686094 RepID=A0A6I6MGL3_9CAUL|nr:PQQ-dependent dehydrogenase, methanol/ethanol family [Terricaulis silvestris]QGZ93800.1 Quinohemoprotein alcohol dehydrogenase ADH-IIG precursor [Terricaulis silvestris]